MKIGDAAERASLPPKTVRYYEDIGLVVPARQQNGYREYAEDDVHRLRFVQRARSLGFSIDECRQLLALWADRSRASADVRKMAAAKLVDIDEKIRQLTDLRATLSHLVETCHGDRRPDCPIIDMLAEDDTANSG